MPAKRNMGTCHRPQSEPEQKARPKCSVALLHPREGEASPPYSSPKGNTNIAMMRSARRGGIHPGACFPAAQENRARIPMPTVRIAPGKSSAPRTNRCSRRGAQAKECSHSGAPFVSASEKVGREEWPESPEPHREHVPSAGPCDPPSVSEHRGELK